MSSGEPARRGAASALAEEAYALVQVRPRKALALAERALTAAVAEENVSAELAALQALAWAQLELGDPRAVATAKAGIRIGERHGDRRGVALLRRRLAVSHAFAGEARAARREIDAAIAPLSGRDRAQSEVFRLLVYSRAQAADPDTYRQICADATKALRVLRRSGDEIWEARLLFNRGLLHLSRGELEAADTDLRRSHVLYKRVGAEAAAVDAVVAVAEIARLRGDVVECLRTLDEAQAMLPPGQLSYNLEDRRATALAQARLLPEARAAAEAYAELCARSGRDDGVATTMLDLAAIALMSLDPATARRLGTQVARSFAARGKPANAALARAVCLRAQLLEGSLRRSSLRSALAAAAVLEAAGWGRDALRTRLLVARVALAVGSHATARRQLELALPLRTRGTVADRIDIFHTRALLCLSEGDSAGAERQLAGGLRLLEDYRAALGAVELRATASGIGIELSQHGLRIAVESRNTSKILAWAERLRGNALRVPLVRPPADSELGALQAELRRLGAQMRAAEEKGSTEPRVAAKQASLEAAIRARSRLVQGEGVVPDSVTHPHDAVRALGDRVLVEYLELDGVLRAVTLANGRLTLHELGLDDAKAELEWLRFALEGRARASSSAQRAAAMSNAQAAGAALDRVLVEPLLPEIGEGPLVVVPTGALHALPWGALPSLRGRPLVVTPSLSVWLGLARRPSSRRRKTALIAGPRLRHSATEVREIASLFPEPTVLLGKAATAASALAALDGAAIAHVACHGHFRSDSPLFSSLELADGPLNVYELQRLRHAPEVLVLSACDLAISRLHPGDELLGVAGGAAWHGDAHDRRERRGGTGRGGQADDARPPPQPRGRLCPRRGACAFPGQSRGTELRLPR